MQSLAPPEERRLFGSAESFLPLDVGRENGHAVMTDLQRT